MEVALSEKKRNKINADKKSYQGKVTRQSWGISLRNAGNLVFNNWVENVNWPL